MSEDGQTEVVEDQAMDITAAEIKERFAPERLLGLMAQLALPEVRGSDGVFRKPRIEIEVGRGQWVPIDSLSTIANG